MASDCAGGGTCDKFIGPDNIACTDDDLTSRGDAGYAFTTTGTISATLEDAVYLAGECSSTPRPCIIDANCPKGTCDGGDPCNVTGDCPAGDICTGGETCIGAGFGLVTVPVPFSGTPISCAQRETSNLAGLITVNAFPFGDAPGLGDGTSTLQAICQ